MPRRPIVAFLALASSLPTAGAQVQENSPSSSLSVNGEAAQGYLGRDPLQFIPGTPLVLTVQGEPLSPLALFAGRDLQNGIASAVGTINLADGQVFLNGFEPPLDGLVRTGLDGRFELGLDLGIPVGAGLAFQALVGADVPSGMLLSAPFSVTAARASLVYLRRPVPNYSSYVLEGVTPFGGPAARISPPAAHSDAVIFDDVRFSSDGRHIAFVATINASGKDDLFVTDLLDDSVATTTQINPPNQSWVDVTEFAWSPDADKLAYVADQFIDDLAYQIFVTSPDGSSPILVSSTFGLSGAIRWSPDSREIAYLAPSGTVGYVRIELVGADGRNGRTVFYDGEPYPASTEVIEWSPRGDTLATTALFFGVDPLILIDAATGVAQLTNAEADVESLRWSPDGERLSFRGADAYIHSIRADGTDTKRISNAPTFEGAWSPDSRYIAFRSDANTSGVYELTINERDGGSDSAVTLVPGESVGSIAWSPDGNYLAYTTAGTLKTVHVESGLVSELSDPRVSVGAWSWEPTRLRNRLVYRGTHGSGPVHELFVVRADGTHLRTIAEDGIVSAGTTAVWAPGGRWIRFEGQGEIFVYDAREHRLRSVTGGPVTSPVWSPEVDGGVGPNPRPGGPRARRDDRRDAE